MHTYVHKKGIIRINGYPSSEFNYTDSVGL